MEVRVTGSTLGDGSRTSRCNNVKLLSFIQTHETLCTMCITFTVHYSVWQTLLSEATHNGSYTHSHNNCSVNHAGRQPARLGQSG